VPNLAAVDQITSEQQTATHILQVCPTGNPPCGAQSIGITPVVDTVKQAENYLEKYL
jgi:hypothetical protein